MRLYGPRAPCEALGVALGQLPLEVLSPRPYYLFLLFILFYCLRVISVKFCETFSSHHPFTFHDVLRNAGRDKTDRKTIQ